MRRSRHLLIALSLLLSCCSVNEIALQSVARGDEFEASPRRQARTFARPEAAVLAAIREVAAENGTRLVVDEPAFGAIGATERRDVSEGDVARQVAANIALAIVFGAGAAGPQNVAVRTETRATVLTRPLPDGNTAVRVTLERWEQRQNRQEFVVHLQAEGPYQAFFDRIAAKLGVTPTAG